MVKRFKLGVVPDPTFLTPDIGTEHMVWERGLRSQQNDPELSPPNHSAGTGKGKGACYTSGRAAPKGLDLNLRSGVLPVADGAGLPLLMVGRCKGATPTTKAACNGWARVGVLIHPLPSLPF